MIPTLILILAVLIFTNVALYSLSMESWPEEKQDQHWWGD